MVMLLPTNKITFEKKNLEKKSGKSKPGYNYNKKL